MKIESDQIQKLLEEHDSFSPGALPSSIKHQLEATREIARAGLLIALQLSRLVRETETLHQTIKGLKSGLNVNFPHRGSDF